MIRCLVAVLFVFTTACATDAKPDDGVQCDPGEGPEGRFHMMFDTFLPQSLTCAHEDETWDCIGTCCHPMKTSVAETPETCSGVCVGLDEAACTANAECYVARDQDAFTAGTDSFIACYPTKGPVNVGDCAMRDANDCAYGGMCAGLYTQTPTSATFVSCIAKS